MSEPSPPKGITDNIGKVVAFKVVNYRIGKIINLQDDGMLEIEFVNDDNYLVISKFHWSWASGFRRATKKQIEYYELKKTKVLGTKYSGN